MAMRAFNEDLIRRFRAGEELEGGMHRDRILLLTTTGRRSGEQRIAPVMFTRFDGDPLVIASNDGAQEHPAWLLNLRDDPHAVAETPDGARTASIAEELTGEDRDVEWDDLLRRFPFLADHQERAGDRMIPLVRLHRWV
jgi:deazaflavin-dependent oxidoreductase (nitroreductase family)